MAINKKNLEKIINSVKNYKNTKLLIVTKKQSEGDILELINMGYNYFGENKVQEAHSKYLSILDQYQINLDLIGPLQTNKVKIALQLFDNIHSVDRKKLVDEIKRQKQLKETKTRNFFIQVNIGEENQKSGVKPNELEELYEYSLNQNLKIRGLMCIPPNNNYADTYFTQMMELKNKLNKDLELSMGMSNDYEKALVAGSNIIRIGSLIFE